MAARIMRSEDMMRRMEEAGIKLPSNLYRVIIDITIGCVPQVYYETHCDEKTADITIAGLDGIKPFKVTKAV